MFSNIDLMYWIGSAPVSAQEVNAYRKESIISTAATMRVLSVLRHWISKHRDDFESDCHLKNPTIDFLEDVLSSPHLLPAEHKAASQLLQLLTREDLSRHTFDLNASLNQPQVLQQNHRTKKK